jgi:hypothetical protein
MGDYVKILPVMCVHGKRVDKRNPQTMEPVDDLEGTEFCDPCIELWEKGSL